MCHRQSYGTRALTRQFPEPEARFGTHGMRLFPDPGIGTGTTSDRKRNLTYGIHTVLYRFCAACGRSSSGAGHPVWHMDLSHPLCHCLLRNRACGNTLSAWRQPALCSRRTGRYWRHGLSGGPWHLSLGRMPGGCDQLLHRPPCGTGHLPARFALHTKKVSA